MAQRRRTKAKAKAAASKPAGVQREKGVGLHEYVVKSNVNVWNEQDKLRKSGFFARAVSDKMIITSSPNHGDLNAYKRGPKSIKHEQVQLRKRNMKKHRRNPLYKEQLRNQRLANLEKARAARGRNRSSDIDTTG